MDRVIDEAGVAKMTLYKAFPTKSALIQETLRHRDEEFTSALKERLAKFGDDAESKLLALFDFAEEWAGKPSFNGCYFVSALTQFGEQTSNEAVLARMHKKQMLDLTVRLCRDLGVRDPKALALEIRLLLEGASVVKLTLSDTGSFRRAKRMAAMLIETSAR